jgi:hypothetical protein
VPRTLTIFWRLEGGPGRAAAAAIAARAPSG